MFCPKCGNEINKNKNFCDNCGEKIKKVSKEEYNNQIYYYEKIKSTNGLSITGFILGILAIIISVVLLIAVGTKDSLNGRNIIFYAIMGLLAGILLLTGLILSIIGTSKSKDAYGIIGIIASSFSLVFEIITLITTLSIVFD